MWTLFSLFCRMQRESPSDFSPPSPRSLVFRYFFPSTIPLVVASQPHRVLIPQVSLVETRSSQALLSAFDRSIFFSSAVAAPLLSVLRSSSLVSLRKFYNINCVTCFSRTFTLLSHFSNSAPSIALDSPAKHPRWHLARAPDTYSNSADFPPLYSLFDLESRSILISRSKVFEDFSCFYFTNDRASTRSIRISLSLSLSSELCFFFFFISARSPPREFLSRNTHTTHTHVVVNK